jgi:8-oxo-dGTP pyrophosphatase MutT (NUDIX family)
MPASESSEEVLGASSLPRRPTVDPRRYLIPAAVLPAGYSAAAGAEAGPFPVPRRASTVVLLREAGEPEVLLLKRPGRSGFAADAWVFPGGVVDESDSTVPPADAGAPARWACRLRLGDPREAWAHVVAALREAWEETGILVGAPELAAGSGEVVRAEVLAGRLPFASALAELGRPLETESLVYVARWITPEREPRRYDTRFFLAPVAAGAAALLHGEELSDALWLPPGEAVEAYRADEMKMLPPTVHTLERLAGYTSAAAALGALREAPVPSFLPSMRPHADGVMVTIEELGAG